MLFNAGFNQQGFSIKLRATPMLAIRPELEDSGKIILPPRALGVISQLNLQYPLMFEVANEKFKERVTHAGVLEFTAEEGRVYIPFWMMQNVRLEPNDIVLIQSRTLKAATFVKLQPQSVDFLDISNPRAVLEQKLRNYSALTKGDTILFIYNKKEYFLQVLEIQPESANKAVSIVETDVKVDFAPPVGYKEPEVKPKEVPKPVIDKAALDPSQQVEEDSEESDEKPKFSAFSGQGARISGKKVDAAAVKKKEEPKPAEPKVTVIDAKGQVVQKSASDLEELRKAREQRFLKQKEAEAKAQPSSSSSSASATGDGFKPFSGNGYRMK